MAQDDSQLLEQHIKRMRSTINSMTEHPSNKARLFVTNEDIVRMQSTGTDTVFAVTAPQGTTLEIPDPDEGFELGTERRYRQGPDLQHMHDWNRSVNQVLQ